MNLFVFLPFLTLFKSLISDKNFHKQFSNQNLLSKSIYLNSKDYVYNGQITPLAGFNESHSSVLSQSIAYAIILLVITTILILIFYFKITKRCFCFRDDGFTIENESTTLKDSFLPP